MFKKRPPFDRNKWQRNLFLENENEEPLWLKIVGGAAFVIFILVLCFI